MTDQITPAPADRGAWMQTYTGRAFFLQTPDVADIDIHDIAHALANSCRFFGHCSGFYSIAQHSVIVSELAVGLLRAGKTAEVGGGAGAACVRMTALAGLLHDAAEAYVGDIVAPLKQLLPDFARIERGVEDAIAARFGLSQILANRTAPSSIRDAVKKADLMALATERRDLLNPLHPFTWIDLPAPRIEPIVPWLPSKAKERFLSRFFALIEA